MTRTKDKNERAELTRVRDGIWGGRRREEGVGEKKGEGEGEEEGEIEIYISHFLSSLSVTLFSYVNRHGMQHIDTHPRL